MTNESSYENWPFVLKPASRSIFELSQKLRHEFENNSRIRTHIDEIEGESVLVYKYFKDNLLFLIKNNADLSVETRKLILRELELSLNDIHFKNWIHLSKIQWISWCRWFWFKFSDLKPNNVMLDWSRDQINQFRIERVALDDLNCALKLESEKLLDHRIENVMWRSSKEQTEKRVNKSSEMFSFELVMSELGFSKKTLAKCRFQCLYIITSMKTLHPEFEHLKDESTESEQMILYRLLSMFESVSFELIAHVNDEYWGKLLTTLSEVVEEKDSSVRFAQWKEKDFSNLNLETKRMILRTTNLDSKKRATMKQIMKNHWWK